MPLTQVERKDDGTYRALRNGRTVATGGTQKSTAERVGKLFPNDTIEVERVRAPNTAPETTGGASLDNVVGPASFAAT
jgi:hypothetical protein